jgi:hypothetical protein
MKAARSILLCALALSLLAAADPFVGTWKLNTHRSKFPPGVPGFFFATILIEASGTGLKSTASGADGEGIASSFTFSCQIDGTPCNVASSSHLRSESAVDTISLKRVDPNTIIAIGARKGKQIYSDRRVVSADSKTMTVVRDGTTPEGMKYETTIVLERLR